MSLLPSPLSIRNQFHLSAHKQDEIYAQRQIIRKILNGEDNRLLMFIGPCSMHDFKSTLHYAEKLKQLSDLLKDEFVIILRAYYEKPRSLKGWKGLVFDPDLNGQNNVSKGIEQTRSLLLQLSELSLPLASELLDLNLAPYFEDLLSWGCIGARTSCSQPHRQYSSKLSFPMGFKNSTNGNVKNAIHGVVTAQSPHVITIINENGCLCSFKTSGNPHCHIILRGSDNETNYDSSSVDEAISLCDFEGVKTKLIVDCSHGNCRKEPKQQLVVLDRVIDQVIAGNKRIGGVMLESHLLEGNQPVGNPLAFGVSVTDPCLSWEQTEKAILEAYERCHKTHLVRSQESIP